MGPFPLPQAGEGFLLLPLSRKREREGPKAKPWEGEGQLLIRVPFGSYMGARLARAAKRLPATSISKLPLAT